MLKAYCFSCILPWSRTHPCDRATSCSGLRSLQSPKHRSDCEGTPDCILHLPASGAVWGFFGKPKSTQQHCSANPGSAQQKAPAAIAAAPAVPAAAEALVLNWIFTVASPTPTWSWSRVVRQEHARSPQCEFTDEASRRREQYTLSILVAQGWVPDPTSKHRKSSCIFCFTYTLGFQIHDPNVSSFSIPLY